MIMFNQGVVMTKSDKEIEDIFREKCSWAINGEKYLIKLAIYSEGYRAAEAEFQEATNE